MIVQLPQILQEITDKVASRVMRGWMELINRSVSSENISSQTTDITTTGNQYINATANITVTLNPDALEDEWVTVRHDVASGNVTITDGIGTVILTARTTVATFRFKAEGWILGA